MEKARVMMVTKGYHATSVRALARELDITDADLYRNYGGKVAVATALVDYEMTHVWNVLQSKAEGRDGKEKLKNWINGVLDFQRESGIPRGFLVINLAGEFGKDKPELQRHVAEALNSMVAWLTGIVKTIERDRPTPNDREIAMFILASLAGSIVISRADKDYWEMSNGFSRLKEYIDGL